MIAKNFKRTISCGCIFPRLRTKRQALTFRLFELAGGYEPSHFSDKLKETVALYETAEEIFEQRI